MRAVVLASSMAISGTAFAQGLADAKNSPQKALAETTQSAGKLDLLSRTLEHCPLEDRRSFLGSIAFIGDKVASLEYRPITGCVVGLPSEKPLDLLIERLGQARRRQAPIGARDGNQNLPLERLFLACSASVRNAFYDGLMFRDGHLVSLFVGGIRKCGEGDLPRFLSLFGADGLDTVEWKQDCYCAKPRTFASKRGSLCNPDDC